MKLKTHAFLFVLTCFILLENTATCSPVRFIHTYTEAKKHNFMPAAYYTWENKSEPVQEPIFA